MDLPADLPIVDPEQASSLHPLEFLQQLSSAANTSGNVTSVAPVAMPMAPQNGDGDGWRSLLHLLAPVIGGVAMGGGPKQTGFLNGYTEGQQAVEEDKKKKEQDAQKRAEIGQRYMSQIADQANNITDPVQFSQFIDTADAAGAKAKYIQPGDLKNSVVFNKANLAKKQLVELTDQLKGMGDNLDDYIKSGGIATLSDGTQVPLGVAASITGLRPTVNGMPLTKAPKDKRGFAKVDALVNGKRQEINFDPDSGKYSDPDTGAPIPSATVTRYDKPANVAPGGVDAQFNDLLELYRNGHGGKDAPADVRTKLRVQAKKEIGQADDRPPVTLNIPGLSNMTPADRVESAADDLINGRMAPSQLATFFSGMGKDSASQLKSLVMQRVKQKQPDFNFAEAESNYQYGKNSGTQTTVRMIDNIDKSIPILKQASADFKRSGVRIINKAVLAAKDQFGDTSVAKFQTARLGMADEIAKILSGGGTGNSTSDSKLKQANDLLAADMSPEQLDAVISTVGDLLQTRRGSLTKGTFMEKKEPPAVNRVYYDSNGNPIKK